ncbi:MAG: hypothetical protein F6K62_17705 [Sphaerospermopsis sp. SIO1G2]|nr:hypothetical protein [Sphaerospermopsis sp. SIO1G1]NET72691.1 hypothetical protein [Sphaerospermopsis sp. SIO1G2]
MMYSFTNAQPLADARKLPKKQSATDIILWRPYFTILGLTQKLYQTPIPLRSLRPLRLDIP